MKDDFEINVWAATGMLTMLTLTDHVFSDITWMKAELQQMYLKVLYLPFDIFAEKMVCLLNIRPVCAACIIFDLVFIRKGENTFWSDSD